MKQEFTITDVVAGERLDIILTKKYPEFSRSFFANLIKEQKTTVNDTTIKPSYIAKINDCVKLELSEVKNETSLPKPENIKLDIIYEDKNVIVLNKQPGLVVHPAAGNKEGTLINALIYYFPQIQEAVYEKGNPVSEARPGLVHRLDKDTSGVMIVAKNLRSMRSLSRQIHNRNIQKIYFALCCGWIGHEKGTLLNYLGRDPKNRKMIADIGKEKGKEAISDYQVINYLIDKFGNKASLVEFQIHTGRTHQIRIQSKIMGHPVLGDLVYGNESSIKISHLHKINRQLLHAKRLTVYLLDEKNERTFCAPTPSDFQQVLDEFTKE